MATTMEWDVVVVRGTMLCEVYGANILRQRGVKVMETAAQTKFTEEQLAIVQGKTVLIAGGYYRSAMAPILAVAQRVTVFLNSSDELETNANLTVVRASATEAPGFATFCILRGSAIEETAAIRIARYLDEYVYGNPSEESLCFQNGVYLIDLPTDLEKIATVRTNEDIDRCIANGAPKRVSNLRTAEQRLKAAVKGTLRYRGRNINAVLGVGDSPIVDTCLLFAQHADLGMLFRYDQNQCQTFVSAIANQNSSLDAGRLMRDFFGGGGSFLMGGASIDGLHIQLAQLIQEEAAAFDATH